MKTADYLQTVKSDLFRYGIDPGVFNFLKFSYINPGVKYTLVMRTVQYLKSAGILFIPLYICARLLLIHYEIKFGISIPYNASIGPGFYIGHFGGIIVNPQAVVGKNCNISHDVTIGAAYGGQTPGVPVIGDNVYLGPGSKIIGGIHVGSNVAIGANCVLTKSVPDNVIVAGIPGTILSEKGSSEYVVNTV